MNKLMWVSVSGDEYQAMIGSLRINLKPVNGGSRWVILTSKPGVSYREERGTVMGPLDNAMRVTENRFLV